MDSHTYSDINFKHLVVFKQENYILAAGRDASGCSCLYLINNEGSQVYFRRPDRWQQVDDSGTISIIQQLAAAFNAGITCYHLNSSMEITQGITC